MAAPEKVVSASGKFVLKVEDPDIGRAVVRAVTSRALREAPGLEVWGVVDDEPVGLAGYGEALTRVRDLHRRYRSLRPSQLVRHPTLPYVRPCAYSGLPATEIGREGRQWHARSAAVHAAWQQAGKGRDRLADAVSNTAVLAKDKLSTGVHQAGWVAVVHADGNGIGEIFLNLHKAYEGAEHLERYRDFSVALDELTRAALREAVLAQPPREDWILPIVMGGDDVTAVIDARFAFDVTVAFLEAFERLSQADDVITEVVEAVFPMIASTETPAKGLTAAAGIAFVKPHHPFSDAYALAEQLCVSAKSVKKVDRGRSALDFHVLHDSVGRDLGEIRAHQVVSFDDGSPLRLWSGPLVVTGDAGSGSQAGQRHVRHLVAAMEAQRGTAAQRALLPTGAAHQLRDALIQGGAMIGRARAQVTAWSDRADEVAGYLGDHLRVKPPLAAGRPDTAFTRIIDAVDLLDMEVGTVEGRARSRSGDGSTSRDAELAR